MTESRPITDRLIERLKEDFEKSLTADQREEYSRLPESEKLERAKEFLVDQAAKANPKIREKYPRKVKPEA